MSYYNHNGYQYPYPNPYECHQVPSLPLYPLISMATGTTGATGWTGPSGQTGETGTSGATGPQGVPGIATNTGASGSTGSSGPSGMIGPTGKTGPTGPAISQGYYTVSPIGPSKTASDDGYILNLNNSTNTVFLLDSTTFPNGTVIYGMDSTNNGRIITLIYNISSISQLSFRDKDAGASAGQQFYLSGATSVNVRQQASITFMYVSAILPGYWVQIAST